MNEQIKNRDERNYYIEAIRKRKMTLPQIATEQGISVDEVEDRVQALYTNKAWADKLLKVASKGGENYSLNQIESVEEVSELNVTRKLALVDTSFLLDFFYVAREYKMVIPRFCMNEIKSIIKYEEKRRKYRMIYEYAEQHAEVIHFTNLRRLTCVFKDKKSRNSMFASYALAAMEQRPEIKILTCSRVARILIHKNK